MGWRSGAWVFGSIRLKRGRQSDGSTKYAGSLLRHLLAPSPSKADSIRRLSKRVLRNRLKTCKRLYCGRSGQASELPTETLVCLASLDSAGAPYKIPTG